LLGLPGEPFLWSLYIFPQLICSIQLLVYFVLARRLSQSRTVGLLTMLVMSFIGLIVYRNQNVAPEIIVLGMVPYIVFYLYRYLETNDWRHMMLAIITTVTITSYLLIFCTDGSSQKQSLQSICCLILEY
ncbi:MAG: glycosyltransferase family 39 protein, partial [Candidatus Heimdallarchaeota archaeon]